MFSAAFFVGASLGAIVLDTGNILKVDRAERRSYIMSFDSDVLVNTVQSDRVNTDYKKGRL